MTSKPLQARSKERTGSPDQKPVALYERIIAASSNPGDIVLDPFAGCATTPIAAHNLGRRWVGIDRREDAAYHVANRLLGLGINIDDFKAQQQALMPQLQASCEIRYVPPVRTDDGDNAPHLGPVYRRRKPATMRRAEMLDILAEQWGIRCWGCGFEPPSVEFLELDHILPDSEGGSNELENRAPLCGPCNKRKSNTMTLTALRRDNRRNERWYGRTDIRQLTGALNSARRANGQWTIWRTWSGRKQRLVQPNLGKQTGAASFCLAVPETASRSREYERWGAAIPAAPRRQSGCPVGAARRCDGPGRRVPQSVYHWDWGSWGFRRS